MFHENSARYVVRRVDRVTVLQNCYLFFAERAMLPAAGCRGQRSSFRSGLEGQLAEGEMVQRMRAGAGVRFAAVVAALATGLVLAAGTARAVVVPFTDSVNAGQGTVGHAELGGPPAFAVPAPF